MRAPYQGGGKSVCYVTASLRYERKRDGGEVDGRANRVIDVMHEYSKKVCTRGNIFPFVGLQRI